MALGAWDGTVPHFGQKYVDPVGYEQIDGGTDWYTRGQSDGSTYYQPTDFQPWQGLTKDDFMRPDGTLDMSPTSRIWELVNFSNGPERFSPEAARAAAMSDPAHMGRLFANLYGGPDKVSNADVAKNLQANGFDPSYISQVNAYKDWNSAYNQETGKDTGEDWKFALGSLALMGGIGGLAGAFGGAGAGGLGGAAGGAMDMGVGLQGWMGSLGESAAGLGSDALIGGAAGDTLGAGGDAWFEQLMQNYNPDLGFQGLNEAGSGLTGGMGGAGGVNNLLNNLPSLPPTPPGGNGGPVDPQGHVVDQSPMPGTTADYQPPTGTVTGGTGFPSIPGGAATSAAGSALSRILTQLGGGAEASASDWASVLGTVGATGLQMYGSSQQSQALTDLAKQYQAFGAPSRARFEASMTPGFNPTSIPGYQGALDSTSQSILSRLSTQGNPFGNPGGLIEANKQIVNGTAMPAVQNYQALNANTGFGSSMQLQNQAQIGAIGADNSFLGGLAGGIGALTAPRQQQYSLADLLKSLA